MFRAYDAERERLVAIKLFRLELPPERVHQLVAGLEALVSADLTHPAIAVPLATGIVDVSAYVAQEYVAAESMDLAVRQYGPAPAADALRVATQLAGALDFAAAVNIHHGALHSRDVLLSADETRLTGLGIARALEAVGVAAPIRRPYTAPERIAGGAWDRRADVFSLAALVYELLCGQRVSGTGRRAAEALTDIVVGRRAALQAAFARALADDPEDRFDTALEFVDALKSALPDVEMKPDVPVVASRPMRRPTEDREASVVVPQLPLDDIDLREAEGERYQEVESAPAVVASADRSAESLALRPPGRASADRPAEGKGAEAAGEPTDDMIAQPIREPISVVEGSRSAVWPLMASLMIGLAIGFAGGYGIASRERAAASATRVSAVPEAAPAAETGREATEVAVSEPAKPAAPKMDQVSPTSNQVTAKADAPAPASGRSARPRATPPPAREARRERPVERATPGAASTSGRYTGQLSVDSRPRGATVYLNGRSIGATPLVLPSVPAGEHAIRIERDGYRRWSSSIRIVAAERTRVTASLER